MVRIVVADPNLTNAPPGWAAVDSALGRFAPPTSLGFSCSARDLNRYWSRYRLAKSFRSIDIAVYTADTVRGYSALFRVFLVWSAFEQLMRLYGLKPGTFVSRLGSYGISSVEKAIRSVPDHSRFLEAVRAELDRTPLIVAITDFVAGRAINLLLLPASIRHIFVHGKLTPNSGVGHVEAACGLSSVLCEFLFAVMDGEFSATLKANGIAV